MENNTEGLRHHNAYSKNVFSCVTLLQSCHKARSEPGRLVQHIGLLRGGEHCTGPWEKAVQTTCPDYFFSNDASQSASYTPKGGDRAGKIAGEQLTDTKTDRTFRQTIRCWQCRCDSALGSGKMSPRKNHHFGHRLSKSAFLRVSDPKTFANDMIL
jgi:hypothetical protein